MTDKTGWGLGEDTINNPDNSNNRTARKLEMSKLKAKIREDK